MYADSAFEPVRPTRVLMTADTLGGVWVYALELIAALREYAVDVVLVTMGDHLSRSQTAQLAGLDNVELHETSYKLEWMNDPWRDVAACGDDLLKIESETRPDVVHINGYSHAALEFNAPVLVVGHSCVYSWSRAVRHCRPGDEWLDYFRAVRRGLGAADAVTAPTWTMLKTLQEFYGPFRSAEPIYNGRVFPFKRRPKKPLVFSAGRLWDEAKNIGALEQAAGSLAWPICVAGQNIHPNGGVADFNNLQMLELLTQQQMALWMAAASIFAMPSRYEPFGLSALEGAICGCALVLGDIPSLREVWGATALYASPDDPDAITCQIERLIEDPHLLRLYAARAAERARFFSVDRMAAGYLRLYTDLLKEADSEASIMEQYAGAKSPA
ncbi:MAG: glycosyltransferase family 4 protein [Phycisphaerae bacterium]|nr:glycosyltransferase family 4 protein [Phycisphaerae bacterium]